MGVNGKQDKKHHFSTKNEKNRGGNGNSGGKILRNRKLQEKLKYTKMRFSGDFFFYIGPRVVNVTCY